MTSLGHRRYPTDGGVTFSGEKLNPPNCNNVDQSRQSSVVDNITSTRERINSGDVSMTEARTKFNHLLVDYNSELRALPSQGASGAQRYAKTHEFGRRRRRKIELLSRSIDKELTRGRQESGEDHVSQVPRLKRSKGIVGAILTTDDRSSDSLDHCNMGLKVHAVRPDHFVPSVTTVGDISEQPNVDTIGTAGSLGSRRGILKFLCC